MRSVCGYGKSNNNPHRLSSDASSKQTFRPSAIRIRTTRARYGATGGSLLPPLIIIIIIIIIMNLDATVQ